MAKLIIRRGIEHTNEFVPKKKVEFETNFNVEMMQDAKMFPDALEQLLDLMADEYRSLLKQALLNLEGHDNRDIQVEQNKTVWSEPIKNAAGTMSLQFNTDTTTVTTIREKQNCD